MRIRESTVAEVVAEASQRMTDPNYSAVMVGGFVQTQTAAAKYVSAHETELGGAEAVVSTIFHAALLALCYQRANNRSVRAMTFEDLDHVSGDDTGERLEQLQPSVHGYIEANVEADAMKRVLYLLALAMDWVS